MTYYFQFKLIALFLVITSFFNGQFTKAIQIPYCHPDPTLGDINLEPVQLTYRLPSHLIPIHYRLEIQPFLEIHNFKFEGQIDVTIDCINDTDIIILNAQKLEIDPSSIDLKLGPNSEAECIPKWIQWSKDDYYQYLFVRLNSRLKAGTRYIFTVRFLGILEDKLKGLYRSWYHDRNGTQRWIAATQFQPLDARRAFPCFDEPGLKATFEIIIVRPAKLFSFSNMEIKRRERRDNGWVADYYATTPPMSTYIVVIVVGHFEGLNAVTERGHKFQVWTRQGMIKKSYFTLRLGMKSLEFFENYFNFPNPLNKTALMALPDFAAAGMENWGLITLRESAMFYDKKLTAASEHQFTLTLIPHEIGHIWFGNLVTPKWWDDIWLNEAFANYFKYIVADTIYPQWKLHDQFAYEELHEAFVIDSYETAIPLSITIHFPQEIFSLFDRLSYAKGCVIVKMMHSFLGERVFKNALRQYIKKFAYKVVRTDDLWNLIQKELDNEGSQDINIKDIMTTWIYQSGYPIVTINRNYDTGEIILQQRKFFQDSRQIVPSSSSLPKWSIPLTLAFRNRSQITEPQLIWLHDNYYPLTQYDFKPPAKSWILGNINHNGYYRINYDGQNWRLLRQQLLEDHLVIPPLNRAQIVGDALALARTGLMSYELALDMLDYLHEEDEYVPWVFALAGLQYLNEMFLNQNGYETIQTYLIDLITPLYKRVSWTEKKSDDILLKHLRLEAISTACYFGHGDCLKVSMNLFKHWMRNPDNYSIPVNLRDPVFCTAISEGGEDEWNFLYDRYRESTPTESITYLKGLASTKNVWLIYRYLRFTIDGVAVRRQDSRYVYHFLTLNPIGRTFAWDFIRDNWDELKDNFDGTMAYFATPLENIAKSFSSKYQLNQFQTFIRDNKLNMGTSQHTMDTTVQAIQMNIAWRKNFANRFLKAVKQKQRPAK